jgi:hypothetical protein
VAALSAYYQGVSLAFVIMAVTLGTDAGAAAPSKKSEHSRVFSPYGARER